MVNLSIQKITIYSASSLIKRFLAAFILVACASHSSHLLAAASEKLQASVDRTQIYQSETVELTVIGQLELEINFSSLFNLRNMELPAPDIGSLKDNFDIIDQQQKYNIQSVNGDNHATITWVYTLAPKKAGDLTIPVIKHDEKASSPIDIKVLAGKPSADDGRPPLIFMEAEVDKQDVYVQEQVVYTLRLYYADNLAGGDLSSPELDNAIVEQVGDQKKYYRMRYNQRYDVIERKFLIFPQKSGALTIAPQTFVGTIIDTRMRKRRHVRDNTEAINVNVLAPASEFSGQTWLPAISLNISEKWDKPVEDVSVGDSFTRTISIQALGLLGSALPPLDLSDDNGFKQYPDQPITESVEHQAGVESNRTESIAMVAIKAGTVTLPEIKIPWWDTINQVERIAVIPSRDITIKAGNNEQSAAAIQADKPPTDSASSLSSIDTDTTLHNSTTNDNSINNDRGNEPVSDNSTTYIIIIVLLISGWIATTILLLKRKPQPTNIQKDAKNTEQASNEASAFSVLTNSIREQSPAVLGDLVSWAKLKWPNITINSVNDVSNLLDDERFSDLIASVEHHYYSSETSSHKRSNEWDADALLKCLNNVRKKAESNSNTVLKGFYP